MRGFRCVPVALKYSPVMAQLTSFERDVVFSALIAQDDRHCLPYDSATLRSEIFPTRCFVAVREIANARDRLVALGVLIRKSSPRKEWLEIAPEYRHTEGRIETSFGDEEAGNQPELSLGPMLFAQEGAPRPGLGPVVGTKMGTRMGLGIERASRAKKSNGVRVESEQKRRETESVERSTSPPGAGPMTRAMGAGSDSEKRSSGTFARGPGEFPNDTEWSVLNRVLIRDMVENGALWAKRWRENRDAVVTGLRDYQALPPELKQDTPERYITGAFLNITQRRAS